MISIELWRAKIGLFNCSRQSRPSSISLSTNLQQQTHGSFSGGGGLFSSLCRSLLIRRALALLLVVVITHLLLSAGDVERNPGPISKDDTPTILDLQTMKRADGMSVIQAIAAVNYKKFGMYLLRDDNVAMVDLIEKDHKGAVSVTEAILKKWLASDAPTRTYQHLIECLRLSELGALAELIAKTTGCAYTTVDAELGEHMEEHSVVLSPKKRRLSEDEDQAMPAEVVAEGKRRHSEGNEYSAHEGMLEHTGSQYSGQSELVAHSTGLSMQHGPIEVHVKRRVCKGLLPLMQKYTDMIVILKRVKLSDKKFANLKSFLSEYCDDESFEECSSPKVVVEQLKEKLKIYIFDISTLTACCKYFGGWMSEARRSIEQYKKSVNRFLSNTPVKELTECFWAKVSRPQDVIPQDVELITLKLDVNVSKDSLKNLKKLMFHLFGVTSKAAILHKVRKGCVCVTWVVSTSLVPILKEKAEQLSPEYLASKGVLELVIGLRIVPNEAALSDHATSSVALVDPASDFDIATGRAGDPRDGEQEAVGVASSDMVIATILKKMRLSSRHCKRRNQLLKKSVIS